MHIHRLLTAGGCQHQEGGGGRRAAAVVPAPRRRGGKGGKVCARVALYTRIVPPCGRPQPAPGRRGAEDVPVRPEHWSCHKEQALRHGPPLSHTFTHTRQKHEALSHTDKRIHRGCLKETEERDHQRLVSPPAGSHKLSLSFPPSLHPSLPPSLPPSLLLPPYPPSPPSRARASPSLFRRRPTGAAAAGPRP